jgi:hypothetical protein
MKRSAPTHALRAARLFALLLLVGGCSKKHPESSGENSKDVRQGSEVVAPAGVVAVVSRSLASELSLAERIELIRGLPEELSEKELEALFGYLSGECPKGVEDAIWLVVGNEVMEVLRHRDLPGLERRFATLAAHTAATAVMRDYAMQHYLIYQGRRLGEPSGDVAERTAVMAADLKRIFVLESAGGRTILGTGFMGLAALNRELGNPAVAALAEDVARQFAVPLIVQAREGVMPANIASAVRLASELRLEDAKEAVRRLAFGTETAPLVKIACLYSLRHYADPQDAVPLRELTDESEVSPVRKVAEQTLAFIENLKSK